VPGADVKLACEAPLLQGIFSDAKKKDEEEEEEEDQPPTNLLAEALTGWLAPPPCLSPMTSTMAATQESLTS
jgi:hypothetical protein